jgi:hypothetical protein
MTKLLPFDPCPSPGGGVHNWIMKAAWGCRLKIKDCTAAEAEGLILDAMTRDPNPRGEVVEAVNKVFNATLQARIVWHTRRNSQPPSKWPEANREQIEAVASSGLGVVDLWEQSPIRFHDDEPHTADILPRLFPGDPLLCAGNKYEFFTMELSKFIGAADSFEQIVPSPMLAKYGRAKEGHLSQHTLEATGPRRFLVVEGDEVDGEKIPKDTQAAVLLHLAERAPLALVVDSGGKSLHGFFFVAGKTDEQLAPFFRRACSLGADKLLWTRSQFARMPGGLRENGNRQHILFFNPETLAR